ncbi:MAG: hypothetical protein IPG45_01300 [Deltaproteobacteria bacterium]|jgi:myo-inositol 2-dehydrogenase/D-chiro-inositol 1-dehydrogenase|nr:hypothetical protein [Deltaproteobacteria bacterium]
MIRLALVADGTEQKALLQALYGVPGAELRYLIGEKGDSPIGEARAATLEAALDDAAVDGVLFGGGPRPQAVEQAIRAGKAVWVPRGLLWDRRRLEHLGGLLEAQPVPLFVPFLRRFDEVLHRLKGELVAGAIGRVESVAITTREPRLSPAREVLPESMADDLDLLRWLLGEEPAEVQAVAGTPLDRPLEAGFDVVLVNLRTRSGRLGQLSHHTRTILDVEQRVEAVGTRGGLLTQSPAADPLTIWLEDGAHQERHHGQVEVRTAAARRAAMAHFVQAVSAGAPLLTSLFDVRQGQLLAEATLESLRSRKIIRISR